MNQEELLELAPGEFTDWEKRVWARGFSAGKEVTVQSRAMRAKLIVHGISRADDGASERLVFRAVYKNTYGVDGTDEDNSYALFTPSADLNIVINNPVLVGKFALGQRYYVDFVLCPEAAK